MNKTKQDMNKNLEMHNLNNPAFCEAKGLSNVWKSYADNCPREEIAEVGFNHNSGYVYIALDNGITICSMLGREVNYLVTDFQNGEEFFYNDYEEAVQSDVFCN